MDKFNLDRNAANSVADKIVPNVMQNLVQKTNDPNDSSFGIRGTLNNLSGVESPQ